MRSVCAILSLNCTTVQSFWHRGPVPVEKNRARPAMPTKFIGNRERGDHAGAGSKGYEREWGSEEVKE